MTESDIGKLYWMKLYTSFFDKHEIKHMWSVNREYVLLYIRMVVESIPNHGNLRFSSSIPYTPKSLGNVINFPDDIVECGLQFFREMDLIRITNDGTIHIPFAEKCMNSETKWAVSKRRQRANVKLENGWRRINDKLMASADGKRKIVVDENEFGGHGMLAVSHTDGKCQQCGKARNVVVIGGSGELTEPDELKVLCHSCAAKELARKNTGVEAPKLVAQSIRKPPEDFQEILDYLTNEEKFLIVNRPALEAKFNELRNRGWKDRKGTIIHDWKNFFMGMAARHLTKAVSLAKEDTSAPTKTSSFCPDRCIHPKDQPPLPKMKLVGAI